MLPLIFRFKTLFVAGERCDVETLEWSKKVFRVPVLDHWWQTGEHFPDMYRNIAEEFKNAARIGGDPELLPSSINSIGSGFSRNKQFFGYPFVKNVSVNDINDTIFLVLKYKVLKILLVSPPLCFGYIQEVIKSQIFL